MSMQKHFSMRWHAFKNSTPNLQPVPQHQKHELCGTKKISKYHKLFSQFHGSSIEEHIDMSMFRCFV